MHKTFLKALLIAAVVALPGLAHAAGLGTLTVKSALGEPLSAEIELLNIQKEELSSLTAKVASREAFTQARLDYLPLLSGRNPATRASTTGRTSRPAMTRTGRYSSTPPSIRSPSEWKCEKVNCINVFETDPWL